MIKIAALGVLAVLLAPATANASTTLNMPDGPAKTLYQRWINQSAMPTADINLEVRLDDFDSGHAAGMEYVNPSRRRPEGRSIRLWFPDISYLAQPDGSVNPLYSQTDLDKMRGLFMHELGHVFDWTHRHDPDGKPGAPLRRGFRKLMTYKGGWFESTDSTSTEVAMFGTSPVVEVFADAYADCAVPEAVYDAYGGYGDWMPAIGQRADVCRLIRRVARRW